MFGEIFRFELRQQLRRPTCWLIFLVFGLLAFWETTGPALHALGAHGDVLRNAPVILAKLFAMLAILSPLAVGTFAATAALRDHDCRTLELLFSTPVSRRAYFGGRFAAAFVLALLTMLVCAVGVALGGSMPWIEPNLVGPADWAGYLWTFGVIVVPAMLFVTALLFLIASATRSLLKTYVGVVVLLVLVLASSQLMHNAGGQLFAALLDPYGYHTLDVASRYWTAIQTSTQVPAMRGALLYNRLLWSAIGLVLLATVVLVPWDRTSVRGWFVRRRIVAQKDAGGSGPAGMVLPVVALHESAAAQVYQLLHWLAFDLKSVLRSTPFLIILLFAMALLAFNLADPPSLYGAANYPLTFLVLQDIGHSFDWLLSITLVFFAGELVWRDRELRVNDTRDASPWRNWVAVVAKCCTLAAVVLVFLLCGALWGIGWQLSHGVTRIQPGLYFVTLVTVSVPYLLLAFLCVFVQVLCGNRFVGYVLTVLWLVVSTFAAPLFDWNDHLFWYATASSAPYSDLNGFGGYLTATWWFNAYWFVGALVLLLVAGLFWLRGTQEPWRNRLRVARARTSGYVVVGLALMLLAFAGCGAWIFHNTHVLNHRFAGDRVLQADAHYEKAYARYRDAPQPRIAAAKLDIAIHPYRRHLDIHGSYTLVNRDMVPVDRLLVYYPAHFAVKAVRFASHSVVSRDAAPHFVVYHLDTPLAPGASMLFAFDLEYAPRGFSNEPIGLFLAHNGTFFDNVINSDGNGHDVLPQFGYQPSLQVTNPRLRHKFGLPPAQPAIAPLGDKAALAYNGASDDAGWMRFDVTLSTAVDQTAITSGVLKRTWLFHGRRYFHYITTAPVPNMLPVASGRYAVRRARAGSVDLDVYYDPHHAWNVGRIIHAAQRSLAYDQKHFGPYQFHQLRIVEVPYNYGVGAESYPGVIVMRETSAGGFITDLDQPDQVDSVYALLAHEISHQWWPYQELPANVRGLNMITESFAQYTALMMMKHRYGVTRLHGMLANDLQRYLNGRRRASSPESPLVDTGGAAQGYIYYDKGALAFYALEDYLGEDQVDRVLCQFVAATRFQPAPYPTSQQFLAMLQATSGPEWQSLIDDLFRKITLFDDRMVKATAKKLPDGKYEVTMHVHAAKYYADGKGKQTRANVDIPIEIGVFAQAKDGEEQDETPLYLKKYPVKDGDSTITVTVDGKPYQAGIDPFNELIDRVSNDNRAPVIVE
ncbi:MAG: ABC transporter permease/M1 family aminopeptidase [Rhodanobacteraceae bacterium]